MFLIICLLVKFLRPFHHSSVKLTLVPQNQFLERRFSSNDLDGFHGRINTQTLPTRAKRVTHEQKLNA